MASKQKRCSSGLTRRERQIMDVVYRRGRATAAEVQQELPEAPSYSAVRTQLRLLEEKGELTHEQQGPRYVFFPTTSRREAGETALNRLVTTFFGGSVERLVSTLLDAKSQDLSEDELDRIAVMIEAARKDEG
jgi:predicted transcriptional regulator